MSAAMGHTCVAAARFAPLPVRRSAPRATTVKAAAHSLSARRGVVELARAVPLATARVARSVGRERQLRVVSVDDPDNPDLDAEPIMSGRPNALWRVLSCLPYLVPLMGSLAFGTEMYDSHPLTSILILVFQPLLQVRRALHLPSLTRMCSPPAATPRPVDGGPRTISVPRGVSVRGTEAPCRRETRRPVRQFTPARPMPAVTVGVPRPSPADATALTHTACTAARQPTLSPPLQHGSIISLSRMLSHALARYGRGPSVTNTRGAHGRVSHSRPWQHSGYASEWLWGLCGSWQGLGWLEQGRCLPSAPRLQAALRDARCPWIAFRVVALTVREADPAGWIAPTTDVLQQ